MEVKELDFEFTHQRRKFKANLQIMHPFKQRMYRVFVATKESKNGEVFIFYEVNEPTRRFFYHYMNDYKDEIAKSIMRQLNQY